MTEETVTARFVFGIIFDRGPKEPAGPPPTVEDNSVVKGLISRRHNQRVVFVGFLLPRRPPVQHERLEAHLAQARADVVGVIRADPALLHSDADEIIVNRGVAGHAVIARALTRRYMRRHRQQFRFARIDSARGKPDERVPQVIDRFLVLAASEVRAESQRINQNEPEIHALILKWKRPGRQSDLAFLKTVVTSASGRGPCWTGGATGWKPVPRRLFVIGSGRGCRSGGCFLVLSASFQT